MMWVLKTEESFERTALLLTAKPSLQMNNVFLISYKFLVFRDSSEVKALAVNIGLSSPRAHRRVDWAEWPVCNHGLKGNDSRSQNKLASQMTHIGELWVWLRVLISINMVEG